ncbi:MAG: acetolactate synthase large subunit [Anaerolineae bacterium]|nr:MAG: acetolactate synthase large subunit [Anaerolineae bacterium]WKZ43534.1 MAG: thiamine pyrophosphate-binding protein [Anaerolineales bacterium]
MTEITVGELLARCLQAEGIEMMFGIIDGAHIPFSSRAGEYGIRHINCRHEEGAVHLAEGYTRTNGKPSVVIGSPGPGGANMLAGLSSAYAEGHPIIAIACTRRRLTTDPERGGAWQATDLVAMAKPITKYSALVRQPERLPEMMRSAFRAALTGRPGPVFIAIPDELLGTKIEAESVPVYPSSQYRMTDMGAGDADWIEQAAELLANSKKPYLHAGKGVLWADASAEFLELGNYLAAGMGSSMGARGVVPEDHPHYFFLFDMQATSLARNEADVVLVVGSRLGEYDGWGTHPAWGMPGKQKTIQIDSDANSIGLNRPVDVGIVADAKSALKAILSKVKEKTQARSEMPDLARYRELTQQTVANGFQFLMAQPTRGLNPGQMVFNARSFFPRNAVTVLDGGNTTLWGVAFNQIYEPRSFLYSVKMGFLGTGIPFAIGAKLAAPERPVYCITGDGAAGFNIMEMETALRENANIVVLVAVDDGWGMERSAHNFGGIAPEHQQGVDISTAMRYDILAQGLGCYGEKVDLVEDLPAALQRAVDSGKPAVLHVTIDPAINADPPGYKQFRYVRTL